MMNELFLVGESASGPFEVLICQQIPAPPRGGFHNLRTVRHRAGHTLLRGQRVGQGGGRSGHRVAHPHGVPLHHRRPSLRGQNSGTLLPRKAGYLGKLEERTDDIWRDTKWHSISHFILDRDYSE